MAYSFSLVATGSPLSPQVHACFAKCRADTGGKFREVVGLVQSVICLLPVSGIYQIVPFRNQVVQRTAARHTAQHPSLPDRTEHRIPYILHPASCCSSFGRGVWNSLKCLILSFGDSALATDICLSYSIKPVGFPITAHLLLIS